MIIKTKEGVREIDGVSSQNTVFENTKGRAR